MNAAATGEGVAAGRRAPPETYCTPALSSLHAVSYFWCECVSIELCIVHTTKMASATKRGVAGFDGAMVDAAYSNDHHMADKGGI